MMFPRSILHAIAALLALAAHLRAADASPRSPRVLIPAVDTPVRIDGKLDDDAWQRAAMIQGFMHLVADRKQCHYAPYQGRVYIAHGPQALHLAVQAAPHSDKPPVADAARRDGSVWLDDSIEVFLDPTPDTPDFYQIGINTRGVVADIAYGLPGRGKTDGSWNLADLRVAATVQPGTWTWELAIPYAGLQTTKPPVGGRWLFNVCQNRTGAGFFTVCNVSLGYAERDRFGELVFGGNTPAVRVEGFGPLESAILQLNLSYRYPAETNVLAIVRGSQYDETADVFFPRFAHDGAVGKTADIVARAGIDKLGNHGKIDVEVKAGANELYGASLRYKITTAVEIEGMRRVETEEGRRLRVTTLQPYSPAAETRQVRLTVADANSDTVRNVQIAITGNKMDVPVDIGGLAPGDYGVTLELVDAEGGTLNTDGPRLLRVYDVQPWRGNTLGISDEVPPPWTPLSATAGAGGTVTVRCWNRRYRFSEAGLLPAGIRSGEQDYLQAPMQLQIALGGTAQRPLGTVTHRLAGQSDRTCVIESRRSVTDATIRAVTTIEFDGFIWIDLFVEPASSPVSLDRLVLEWSMPPAQSTLLNSGIRRLVDTGLTPPTWNRAMYSHEPAFWVGNEQGGMAFSAESFEHWSNRDARQQVQLSRDGNGTTIGIHIVNEALRLKDAGVEYGFCFHPTPVRPLPAGHRRIRSCSWTGSRNFREAYPPNMSFWNATTRFMGAPQWVTADNEIEAYYTQLGRKYHPHVYNYHGLEESGVRSTWYATFSHTARNSPEFIWFGGEWRAGSKDQLYANAHFTYRTDMVAVCKTRDYCDYYLWRFDKSRREDPLIDGLYLDLMHLPRCNREDHGHGFVHGEGRHWTYAIREHRAWLLRNYTYLKSIDPDIPVMSHLSGHSAHIMAHPFTDYLWDGELWVREVQEDLSYENLSLDTFRAETTSTAYGPKIYWINQLYRALSFLSPEERKTRGLKPFALRHYLAMLLVHDIMPAAGGHEQRQVIALWKLFDRFGLDDADRLLPYWEGGTGLALQPANDNIVATAYVKPARALIVVFNNTDEERGITVSLDPARVFGPPSASTLTFRDAEQAEANPLAKGTSVTLPIGKRDFRALWIE